MTARDRPPPWWLRAYLLFAAVQGLGIGLTGLLIPTEMQIPLRITPLNARFTAALYIAGGLGVLWAALGSRRRADTLLFVYGFGAATALILVVTILHWSEFMADDLPHRQIWMFDYVVDPLLALIIVPAAGLWPDRAAYRHRLTPLFILQSALFGALGLALLLAPDAIAGVWPWSLPPVLGQLYACFFLTFAIGAAFAARESATLAVRGFTTSSLALMVLVLGASLLHLDRFKAEPVTWVWFAVFAVGLCAFAIAGLVERTADGLQPAPASAQ